MMCLRCSCSPFFDHSVNEFILNVTQTPPSHTWLFCLPVCLQCEKKETFIQQIQSLDIETQAAIANHIQQVLLSINQMERPPCPQRYSPGDHQYEEILSSGDTSKRIFVPKYDLARHFFTVWPGDRRSEAIIPSTGVSSECENELLVILLAAFKGPLGAPRCHHRMDLPPLMSNSPPPPFSHHPLSFHLIFPLPHPLSSPIKDKCQIALF